jgi:hypothetical protein
MIELGRLLAACSALLCLRACAAGVVEIDVLPSGASPAAARATAAPGAHVATSLHEAQRQARAAAASGHDAVVTLQSGTHHLLSPLRFGGEDSGGGQSRVVYRADPAAPLGTVAVSGGAPLPQGCFKKTAEAVAGGTVYKCELSADFPVKFFEQLFVNGKRCPRARFPNFDPLDPTVDGGGYFNVQAGIPHPDKQRWPSLGDAGITYDPENFSPREWNNSANNATMHMFPWGHASWGEPPTHRVLLVLLDSVTQSDTASAVHLCCTGILIYDGIERLNDTLTWKRGGWHINTHEFPNGDKPHGNALTCYITRAWQLRSRLHTM